MVMGWRLFRLAKIEYGSFIGTSLNFGEAALVLDYPGCVFDLLAGAMTAARKN